MCTLYEWLFTPSLLVFFAHAIGFETIILVMNFLYFSGHKEIFPPWTCQIRVYCTPVRSDSLCLHPFQTGKDTEDLLSENTKSSSTAIGVKKTCLTEQFKMMPSIDLSLSFKLTIQSFWFIFCISYITFTLWMPKIKKFPLLLINWTARIFCVYEVIFVVWCQKLTQSLF